MSFLTPESIRRATGGQWVVPMPEGARCEGVCIDSREVRPGRVFVALRGERTDGHRFVHAAAAAGSPLAIVESEGDLGAALPAGMGVLRVAETEAALLRMAAAYRTTLGRTRVVGVTGSNGKTTTVRLVEAMLRAGLRGTASRKSFNNRIGMSLTVLGARAGDDYLVCEVGSNAAGEIAELAGALRPDVGVITSIGRAHLEGLASLEGVAEEKSALLRAVQEGGLRVVPAGSRGGARVLEAYLDRDGPALVRFGVEAGADVRIVGIEHGAGAGEGGLVMTLADGAAFRVPLLGEHNALNAAAAVAVARWFGLSDATISAGLASFKPAEMRLARVRVGEVELINDAYNANPDSMLAALRVLEGCCGARERRVAVLGDMLEVGSGGDGVHEEVLGAAMDVAGRVVVIGEAFSRAAERLGVRPTLALTDLGADGAGRVASIFGEGDTVLLKGSRGMALERVADALEAWVVKREQDARAQQGAGAKLAEQGG